MISLQLASRIADQAETAAREARAVVAISVVDEGGHLVLFRRMDGVPFGAVRFSERKAMSAAALGAPTAALGEAVKALPGLVSGAFDGIAFVGGGVPIRLDGRLAGGVGVAGGYGDQDDLIAKAGLAGLDG